MCSFLVCAGGRGLCTCVILENGMRAILIYIPGKSPPVYL